MPKEIPIDKSILEALTIVRGDNAVKIVEQDITPDLYPISAAQQKTKTKENYNPGDLMPDRTIYLGKYSPQDQDGHSLDKIFNVFAAPQDLPDTMTYANTVEYIAKLKRWNGYGGTNYATDKEINAALKDGSYNGGWIIPPRELLIGTEPDGVAGIGWGTTIQPDNLFAYQHIGHFKNTFKTAYKNSFCDVYWSSTQDRNHPFDTWAISFLNGNENSYNKNIYRLSCRPVRLVEIPPFAAT